MPEMLHLFKPLFLTSPDCGGFLFGEFSPLIGGPCEHFVELVALLSAHRFGSHPIRHVERPADRNRVEVNTRLLPGESTVDGVAVLISYLR